MDELLTLPGVGRKTANLVLILSHASRDNICVDTHVHRISNRLGWVKTRTPDQTEQALYRVVPRRWWPRVNLYLVTWGQNVCRPVYPRCRACVVSRALSENRRHEGRSGEVHGPDDDCDARRDLAALLDRGAACQTRRRRRRQPVVRHRDREGHVRDPAVPGRRAEERRAHPRAREAAASTAGSAFIASTASLVQFGDPQSRDMTQDATTGAAAAADNPIGVAEISKKHTHVRGAVGARAFGQSARPPTASSTS